MSLKIKKYIFRKESLIILVLMGILVSGILRYDRLRAEGKYAIGTTCGIQNGAHGIRNVIYRFKSHTGMTYEGSTSLTSRKAKTEGGKYLVVYAKDNPATSEILLEKELTTEELEKDWNSIELDPNDVPWR